MRFYGIRSTDVDALDIDEFNALLLSIPVLEAKEALFWMEILDFPHLKHEARKKIFKRYLKRIKDVTKDGNNRSLTNEELFAIIQGR